MLKTFKLYYQREKHGALVFLINLPQRLQSTPGRIGSISISCVNKATQCPCQDPWHKRKLMNANHKMWRCGLHAKILNVNLLLAKYENMPKLGNELNIFIQITICSFFSWIFPSLNFYFEKTIRSTGLIIIKNNYLKCQD